MNKDMNKSFQKLLIGFSATAVSAVLFFVPLLAQAAEAIGSYEVDITINQDSSILVKEKIGYDFGQEQRHGIFREIPYKYEARGGAFKLRVSNITVTGKDGNSIPFEKSTTGGNVVLKIGDPDVYVTGVNEYNIIYTVKRAINFFDDHDELYWNAIGTGWEVPISASQAVVRAPKPITKMQCFTGEFGSDQQNCTITGGNTETVTFATTGQLGPAEGLTIVAGFPKGVVAEPTAYQKFLETARDNGILLLPVLVFAGMFYLWRRFGRDPKSKNTVVAQYDPPDKMSPLYMGTLLHNKTTNKDIAAEVVYLAANGYLTIKQTGADYEFTHIAKQSSGLAPQTKALLDELFPAGKSTAKLSELKKEISFGKALLDIRTKTPQELAKQNYFRRNPAIVKTLWSVAAIFGAVVGSILFGNLIGYLGVIAAIVSGMIVLIFSFIMPARTEKGVEAVAHIRGLEQYLTVAEKDRLQFHNAPEKNPQIFERLLPFAIALGVEKQWAEQFKDLTQAPAWFADSSGQAATFATFANSFDSFSSSMQSAASRSISSASSGGSGFSGGGSGGGGGGGGGGSW
jgi:uncharacterized membrane protein